MTETLGMTRPQLARIWRGIAILGLLPFDVTDGGREGRAAPPLSGRERIHVTRSDKRVTQRVVKVILSYWYRQKVQ